MQREWERRKVDPSFLLATNTAGAFRAFTFRESLPKEWFESDFHAFFYGSLGVYDVLQVGFPLGPEAESHIVIQRIGSRRAFSVREKSLAAQALRGIKGFHRHLMLSHGLLVSSAPLTPVERRVMKLLLTGASEKEIAHSAELAVTITPVLLRAARTLGRACLTTMRSSAVSFSSMSRIGCASPGYTAAAKWSWMRKSREASTRMRASLKSGSGVRDECVSQRTSAAEPSTLRVKSIVSATADGSVGRTTLSQPTWETTL